MISQLSPNVCTRHSANILYWYSWLAIAINQFGDLSLRFTRYCCVHKHSVNGFDEKKRTGKYLVAVFDYSVKNVLMEFFSVLLASNISLKEIFLPYDSKSSSMVHLCAMLNSQFSFFIFEFLVFYVAVHILMYGKLENIAMERTVNINFLSIMPSWYRVDIIYFKTLPIRCPLYKEQLSALVPRWD